MAEIRGVLKGHEFQQNYVGNMFLRPPDGNFCRINIFGEISHLTNFSEEDLYFFYEFYLPDGYKLDDENDYYKFNSSQNIQEDLTLKLKSISQVSSYYPNSNAFSFTKPRNFAFRYISNNYKENEDEFLNTNATLFHNFSFPFDIELLGHYDAINVFNPKLLFQINSVDYDGRHKIQGYSFVDIPIITGSTSVNVPCFRPQEDMYLKEYSYFLGGSRTIPNLADLITTQAVNENNEPIGLNRYGIKTEYAGDICINTNVVVQDRRLLQETRKRIKEKKGMEDYNFVKGIEEATGEKFVQVKEIDRTAQMQSSNFGMINRQGA